MTIALIGDLSSAAYETWRVELSRHLPADETLTLATQLTDKSAVDVVLAANPRRGELATFPNLRFVQSLWAGVDGMLGDPALPKNITLARLVDPVMAQSMLEGAIAAVLFLHRQFPAYLQQQATHTWRPLPQPMAAQCNVGVLGFGTMGEPVARALVALGFCVSAWGSSPRPGASVDYSWGADGLERLLAKTQVLVNLLPLTAATGGILNAELFRRLPEGAALINLGRGAHLNDADLLDALQKRHLSHAMLDVFHSEPLPADHPFWSHPQVTVMPHVAASTGPDSAAPIAMQNVVAFRAGRPLTGVVVRSRGY